MNIDKDIKNIRGFIRSIRADLEEDSPDNFKLATSIENVLSELEIKDKMIDLMAQTLLNYGFVLIKSRKGIKEYFRKKAQNE